MHGWMRELRLALRSLSKERSFSITVFVTLVVALLANAVIFAIVSSVLLRPLGIMDSNRIVLLYNSYPGAGMERAATSASQYVDRLSAVDALEDQTLFNVRSKNLLSDRGEPRRVRAMQVTPSFFGLVRAQPSLGRSLADDDTAETSPPRVVLSDALWQRMFGGGPTIDDRTIRIDDVQHEIVGVMPAGFSFYDRDVELWLPAPIGERDRAPTARHNNNWTMLGRLAPGRSVRHVQAQVDALTQQENQRFPQFRGLVESAGFHTRVVNLRKDMVAEVRQGLILVWAGAAFVLLIALVNIANLSAVRAASRSADMAVRLSMGASRGRLARQLIVEMCLLGLMAGVAATLGAMVIIESVRHLGLDVLPRGEEIAVGWAVWVAMAAGALVLGFAMALIPIGRMWRMRLSAVLREEGRGGTAGRSSVRIRRGLATSQVAFALILVTGGGLLLWSYRTLTGVDLGFRPDGVLTFSVAASEHRYPDSADLVALVDQLQREVSSLPTVRSSGIASSIPFADNYSSRILLPVGQAAHQSDALVSLDEVIASPAYVDALGLELIAGRWFDARDRGADAAPVVVVDERVQARFWPEGEAVGRRLYVPMNPDDPGDPGPEDEHLTVIGVVGTSALRGLESLPTSVGTYYRPVSQQPLREFFVTIRGIPSSTSLLAEARQAVGRVDAQLPLFDARSMTQRIDDSLAVHRMPMLLVCAFGAIALFLASIGLYGLLSYIVTQRQREIGIRIALGSNAYGIGLWVAREGVRIFLIGVVLGWVGLVVGRKALVSQLHGVEATDPRALLVGLGVSLLVCLVACGVPALRAARMDPIESLRS